ncbi:MAG TPA: carboxymuconolactone decarboxylase family protein [Caulobacterales bacterium]|nr:carboxymuconolactone decarboxylase family protein [Caulobacterales bacterium]
MSITALANALPPYAEDLKINLERISEESVLSDQQKWGCFLACAFASGVPALAQAIRDETDGRLAAEARWGAKAAAAMMGMNTVYYGAINLISNHSYRSAPANLSMNALTKPPVDKIDFELWAFAVSAMSNCGACLNSHEAELHKRGVTLDRVQSAVRIAAIINAIGLVLRGEAAMAGA